MIDGNVLSSIMQMSSHTLHTKSFTIPSEIENIINNRDYSHIHNLILTSRKEEDAKIKCHSKITYVPN